jgi:hypothetical protein
VTGVQTCALPICFEIGAADGHRYLYDFIGTETVVLDAAIPRSSLQFAVDGNGVRLTRSGSPDWSVQLWGLLDPAFFGGGEYAFGNEGPLEMLEFLADGSVLTAAQMRALLPAGAWLPDSAGADTTLTGDAQRNSIWGLAGNDVLAGGGGDDWLYGGTGNDVSTGGLGNDWIDDADGADTYHFARGDGQDYLVDNSDAAATDRLVFGPGINPADVTVHLDGDNSIRFELTPAGGGPVSDSIVVLAWRDPQQRNQLERIEFSSSPVVWTAAAIDAFLGGGQALPQAALRAHGLSAAGIADALAGFAAAAEDDVAGFSPDRRWPLLATGPESGLA